MFYTLGVGFVDRIALSVLQRCAHFKTIRFQTIVEIKPSKSACHEEETIRG